VYNLDQLYLVILKCTLCYKYIKKIIIIKYLQNIQAIYHTFLKKKYIVRKYTKVQLF